MNLFDSEESGDELSNFRLDEINVAKEIMEELQRPSPPLPMIYPEQEYTKENATDENDTDDLNVLNIQMPSPIIRESYEYLPWHHTTRESWIEYLMIHGNNGTLHTRLGTFTINSWNPDHSIDNLIIMK
jgi:hypothetical protein